MTVVLCSTESLALGAVRTGSRLVRFRVILLWPLRAKIHGMLFPAVHMSSVQRYVLCQFTGIRTKPRLIVIDLVFRFVAGACISRFPVGLALEHFRLDIFRSFLAATGWGGVEACVLWSSPGIGTIRIYL